MGREKKLVAASVLIFILFQGCIFDSESTSVEVVSVGNPDVICHSGERIALNVTVKSSVSMDNITVSISGLKNKLGVMKLHESKAVDLVCGINVISFICLIPACSSCNHLEQGIYYVNATVLNNGEIIAHGSGTIDLKA